MKETFLCFSLALFCSRLTMASDSFTVNCAENVIIGKYGSSVILPCWLNPKISAENLEIRWYRPDQFKTPLLFYQYGKILTDYQDTYKNRSSLTSSSSQSTGLKEGDVSLRLDNLDLSDIGIFHCYVSGDKSFDRKIVTLEITALGSPLLISLERHHKSVNLSSSSCGWFPKPSFLWKSTHAHSDLQSTIYIKQKNGLFCIYSWMILSSSGSNVINCSVVLSEEEKTSVSVYLEDGLLDYSVVWKIFSVILLLCVLALMAISFLLFRKYRGYMVLKKLDEQSKDQPANMEDLRKSWVTIKLDAEKCKNDALKFTLNADAVRDNSEAVNIYKGQSFPYDLCVYGTETFRSGRVYWEVTLIRHNVSPRKSWLVGVADASHIISEKKIDLMPSNGFWFLCSDPKNGLRVNTGKVISILSNKTVECVGVLLDFDKSELSFYSATDSVCLCTIPIKPQGEVVPLFNPGFGDEAPLQVNNPNVNNQNQLQV